MGEGDGDVAWFPAFHCGVDVQAAIDAGFRVAFYPVGLELDPEPDTIRALVAERPGPLVVIHYFGHPSPRLGRITDVCEDLGVPLVEDACHGPLRRGGDQRGPGQVVAFSLRKVLGSLDGGALTLDRGRIETLRAGPTAPSPPGGRRAVLPLLEPIRRRLGFAVRDWADARHTGSRDVERSYNRRISWPSERFLASVDPEEVARRRRRNWIRLRDGLIGLAGFRPVFPDLGADAVPLSLAVRVRDREELVRALLADGVDSYTFGQRAHPALPSTLEAAEAENRDEILGLPVHHDLREDELETVVEVLRRHLPGHALDRDDTCAG